MSHSVLDKSSMVRSGDHMTVLIDLVNDRVGGG